MGLPAWREGRLDGARKNLEISSEMREGLAREHPNLPWYRTGVGWSRMRLGQVHRDAGRLAEARADLGRACDALEVAVRINPGDHWSRNILGIAYSTSAASSPGSGRIARPWRRIGGRSIISAGASKATPSTRIIAEA